MSAAGMDFPRVLAALTSAPAEWLGESERTGRIAPGLLADLVVLQGGPGEDIEALARVTCTMRGGLIISRAEE